MPRTKGPARRLGTGEGSSSNSLAVQGRNRRYESHGAVLRELRQIERHMQPAIARLPFQRLVREICEEWRIGFRWAVSALLCLQEITEGWLIEFFEDSYLLAAFAHRVTIMPWDFEVLRRLRYRYDQLLLPGFVSDRRMRDILTVPPLHPRARQVEPSQVVHDRDTRSQCRRIEEAAEQTAKQDTAANPMVDPETVFMPEADPITDAGTSDPITEPIATVPETSASEAEEYARIRELELDETDAHNNLELTDLVNHGSVRLAFTLGSDEITEARPQPCKRTIVGTLEGEDLGVLQNSDILCMTDSLMQPILWYCLSLLPPEVQVATYFIDSLISAQLRNPQTDFLRILNWFRGVNLDEAKLIMMAYHERSHWSLVAYCIQSNTLYFANSVRGYHGRVRECALKLMACIEHLVLDDLLPTVRKIRLSVPAQLDDVSCGWRTALNALLLMKKIFNIPDERPMESYLPSQVREFRIKAVQGLVVAVHERAQDEITNAALYARQAEERRIQQDEADQRSLLEYQQAMRNHEVLQAEVDEFVAQQTRTAVERAWEAEVEARDELSSIRTTQFQSRPPHSSRGRRGGRHS